MLKTLIIEKLERDLRWYNSLLEDCKKGTKDRAYLTGLQHGTLNAMRIVDSMEEFVKEITDHE